MKTIDEMFDTLALSGGQIVSTAKLQPWEIESARQTNRLFVRDDSLGFVWEPEHPGHRFPSVRSEVEALEAFIQKWYPVDPPIPESLKPENFFARLYGQGSVKNKEK